MPEMKRIRRLLGTITVCLNLAPGALRLLGHRDSDKLWCPPSPMRIVVNGQVLFDNPSPFPKRGWSTLDIPVPAELLREGKNAIEIRNDANTDRVTAAWTMIAEVHVLPGR